MASRRQFEDDIIRWLLGRYGLLDTRTRHMLLDREQERFERACSNRNSLLPTVEPSRTLAFQAFNEFFPGFTFVLGSVVLRSQDCGRMTFPKSYLGFGTSPIARSLQKFLDYSGHPDRFAVVFRWPYQKYPTDSIVLHNGFPLDTTLPGMHWCWRLEDNSAVVLQTLPAFAATADKILPSAQWMQSALDPGYSEIVDRQGDDTVS